jgi:hypothetical protein
MLQIMMRDGLDRFAQIDLKTFEYHLNSAKSLMKKHRYNRETKTKLLEIFSQFKNQMSELEQTNF